MENMAGTVSGTLTRTGGDAPADAWWLDVGTALANKLLVAVSADDGDSSGVSGRVYGTGQTLIDAGEGEPDAGDVSRPVTVGVVVDGIGVPDQEGLSLVSHVPCLAERAWQGLTFSQGGATWQLKVTGVELGVYRWPRVVTPTEDDLM